VDFRTLGEQFHPRDIIRNMIMFEVIRSLLLAALRSQWPGYSMGVLDLVALSAGVLDHPDTRSWPRMVLAGLLVELIRYGMAHAPHMVLR
jgi:hypothetical protein